MERENIEWNETDGYGKTWKTDKKKIRLLWQSQCYAIGETIKDLWDIARKAKLPEKEKILYCEQLKDLYEDVENETLKWEKLQKVVFLSGMDDNIKKAYGFPADLVADKLALQYVMLQLNQWNMEEEEEEKQAQLLGSKNLD